MAGTGESFAQFPVCKCHYVRGDRGTSTAAGVAHGARLGGRVTVRVNTGHCASSTTETVKVLSRASIETMAGFIDESGWL